MNPELMLRTRKSFWVSLAASSLLVAACSGSDAAQDASVEPEAAVAALPSPAAVLEEDAAPAAEDATSDSEVPQPEATGQDIDESSEPANSAGAATTEPDVNEAESSIAVETLDGVITDIVADAQGGRAFFDGMVNEEADLENLVLDAWGDGDLGLHRGHRQVQNVLEAFLGIDHDAMHDFMDQGLNLAATAEAVNQNPDALVESLTNSYIPFVSQAVENGVISPEQADGWIEQLRTEFDDRVYWDGVSAS